MKKKDIKYPPAQNLKRGDRVAHVWRGKITVYTFLSYRILDAYMEGLCWTGEKWSAKEITTENVYRLDPLIKDLNNEERENLQRLIEGNKESVAVAGAIIAGELFKGERAVEYLVKDVLLETDNPIERALALTFGIGFDKTKSVVVFGNPVSKRYAYRLGETYPRFKFVPLAGYMTKNAEKLLFCEVLNTEYKSKKGSIVVDLDRLRVQFKSGRGNRIAVHGATYAEFCKIQKKYEDYDYEFVGVFSDYQKAVRDGIEKAIEDLSKFRLDVLPYIYGCSEIFGDAIREKSTQNEQKRIMDEIG